jgi:tetratricopeptide (TPR) repeat protein
VLLRNQFSIVRLLGVFLLLTGLLAGGSAIAACQPGQMQEADLAYNSAAQFLASQQWDQAIARLQSIVNVCPEHVEATRGVGTAYMGKGDYASAIEWFNKVVALRADNTEAGDFANTAKAYAKLKKYKEARAEYMKAEQLAPDDCGVLFNLGVMHYAAGFHPQSVDVLEHALDVCPQYRDNILSQLSKSAAKAAEQQRKAGNNAKAQFYDELMTQYGGAAGGSTTYDMVKQKMGEKKYGEAAALLDQMLAKNPDQPNAWLTLARVRDANGQKGPSVTAYQKYLEAKPNDANAWGAMIQVMVEDGKCTEANEAGKGAAARLVSQGAKALAPINFSWGMALECLGEYETAGVKFNQVLIAGNSRYIEPARTNVQRMKDLQDVEEYKKKKARQGG